MNSTAQQNSGSYTLRDVASYFHNGRAHKTLLSILRAAVRVFNFGAERANRLRRFVLVTRDYAQGVKVKDIAIKYECSRGTVMRHARIAGLAKRDKSPVPGRKEGILTAYVAGEPIAKIAANHRVSVALVSKIAGEAGVLRRKFKK